MLYAHSHEVCLSDDHDDQSEYHHTRWLSTAFFLSLTDSVRALRPKHMRSGPDSRLAARPPSEFCRLAVARQLNHLLHSQLGSSAPQHRHNDDVLDVSRPHEAARRSTHDHAERCREEEQQFQKGHVRLVVSKHPSTVNHLGHSEHSRFICGDACTFSNTAHPNWLYRCRAAIAITMSEMNMRMGTAMRILTMSAFTDPGPRQSYIVSYSRSFLFQVDDNRPRTSTHPA